MCEPATIMLAISAASTLAGASAASKNAKNQIALTNQAMSDQQVQSNLQASGQKMDRAKQAEAERARLRVAAAESGISGITPGTLLMDSFMQQGQDVSNIAFNADSRSNAATQEALARNTQASNTVPSFMETGLAIAGHVASYDAKTGNVFNGGEKYAGS